MATLQTKDGLLVEVVLDNREVFGPQLERYTIHSKLNPLHKIMVLSSRCELTEEEKLEFPLDRQATGRERFAQRQSYMREYAIEAAKREREERIQALKMHTSNCHWNDSMYDIHPPCDCGFENPRRDAKPGEGSRWW